MIIKPTPGRVVWFREAPDQQVLHHDKSQPLAATIAYVHHDRMVNLTVHDANGGTHARTSVRLLQDGDKPEGEGMWCEWMPYQVGQAKGGDGSKPAANTLAAG